MNLSDFVGLTIGDLDLNHHLVVNCSHTTMLFSSTCTLVTSIPASMTANRSRDGAAHTKSSKF